VLSGRRRSRALVGLLLVLYRQWRLRHGFSTDRFVGSGGGVGGARIVGHGTRAYTLHNTTTTASMRDGDKRQRLEAKSAVDG